MATIQNSVQKLEFSSHTSDTSASFQEIYRNNYSHGLEFIYKLEKVNPESVRKLTIVELCKNQNLSHPIEEWLEPQFTFDFGLFYRGWMVPYIYEEPIQVLQLAKPIEKILLTNQIKTLRELRQCDLQSLKLGQGHIVDIRAKLKEYFDGKEIEKITVIDFLSLIKCILGDKDLHKVYVLLEPYELHTWISLTPSETMEIRRATVQQKNAWIEEVKKCCRRSEEQAKMQHYFLEIVETWVKPWMKMRGGVALKDELLELLILKSKDTEFADKALKVLFELGDVFSSLIKIDDLLLASEEDLADYLLIHNTAISYFVNCNTTYFLSEITHYIAKELALNWLTVDLEQIFHVLKTSRKFRIFRGDAKEPQLKLNF